GRGAGGEGTAELERRGDPEPPSGASRHLPPEGEGKSLARVFHADLYGTRAVKYATLDAGSVEATAWTELAPASPNYFFVPEDGALREEYERGWKITEAMPVNVLGFQTHRDDFAIDMDREILRSRIAAMRDMTISDGELARDYALRNNRDWQITAARKALCDDERWDSKLIRIAYRPFDCRWGYFSEVAMDYPRRELIENVAGKENTCLGIGRAGVAVNEPVWSLQTVSHAPMDANIYRRGGVNIFPLWLYPREATDLLDTAPHEKTANLAPEFVAALTEAVGDTPTPEDTLAYIYAILYAPSYRTRYAEFLKRDFPRVPLTANRKLFDTLVGIGRELIALHTMQATLPRITGFPVAGSNEVAKVRYTLPSPPGRGVGGEGTNTHRVALRKTEPSPGAARHPLPVGEGNTALLPGGEANSGRVWINDAQYFDGVPEAVWDMHIGGYRVAEKWLKDRKGRLLSFDDIEHYQRVIAALARTLALQAELDAAVTSAGGWPLHRR
ncbi:MAG TPA: type ISP restriction/modification enzyme, partial [Rhodanobacteraceae bacterium]|nr:type ISP restriction/modification enzyme [Rhodanobacteraceae bacterium]